MYDLWRIISLSIIMLTLSIIDIKHKRIPYYGIAIVMLISVIWILQENPKEYIYFLLGCTPGIAMIFTSIITGGRVGAGDGLLVMALGLGMGMEKSIVMLGIALILCCIASGALFMGHKVSGKSKIPFVPFITLGMEVIFFAY